MDRVKCKSRGCKGSGYKKQSQNEKTSDKAKADEKLAEILAQRKADEEKWTASSVRI